TLPSKFPRRPKASASTRVTTKQLGRPCHFSVHFQPFPRGLVCGCAAFVTYRPMQRRAVESQIFLLRERLVERLSEERELSFFHHKLAIDDAGVRLLPLVTMRDAAGASGAATTPVDQL